MASEKVLLKILVFCGRKNHATGPRWSPGCQLRGWLIRPDNDACPCPPPRTRMAATLNGGRWGVECLGGEEVEIKETEATEN